MSKLKKVSRENTFEIEGVTWTHEPLSEKQEAAIIDGPYWDQIVKSEDMYIGQRPSKWLHGPRSLR